jgi:hypothetical protein
MSKVFISAAASTRESSGLILRGVGVLMSFIFIFIFYLSLNGMSEAKSFFLCNIMAPRATRLVAEELEGWSWAADYWLGLKFSWHV